jgi:hypothetical protein
VGLLDDLTGGGQAQQDYQGFVGRYDQGAPYDGISDEEAQQRHDELAQQLSPGDYQQAAQDSFTNMSGDERAQVGQQLADHAQQQGLDSANIEAAGQGDPSSMGAIAGMLHEQAPGIVGQVLGGGGQASKGALAGIVANAARRFLG